MIIDLENQFSDKQAITATAASTEYIDTKSSKDIGIGARVGVFLRVTEAFNNLTSLQVVLQGGNTVNASDAPTWADATAIEDRTYALAALNTAGKNLPFSDVPQGGAFRFYRLNYVVTGTAPTTGRLSAGLLPSPALKPANRAVTY